MQVRLKDIYPSPHTHTEERSHTFRKRPFCTLTFIKTLISNAESLGERNLTCRGEERDDKQQREKNRGEKQTDGQRDRGQRTEVQSAQVGMKNGFRRGGGAWRCVLSKHWKKK